ncbi:hypothetical protein B0H15DRAFT_645712 [Mycena belliarum]|uniref:Uncharacterized protein n=1 Tax=Mycena belliarum TaxID=1033014 RepID=A0AAD6XWR2_9AGAR|nr:hypothetical protein B0H15DRAFT_645712 [Mycena belliae]
MTLSCLCRGLFWLTTNRTVSGRLFLSFQLSRVPTRVVSRTDLADQLPVATEVSRHLPRTRQDEAGGSSHEAPISTSGCDDSDSLDSRYLQFPMLPGAGPFKTRTVQFTQLPTTEIDPKERII